MNKEYLIWIDFINGHTYAYGKIYELYAKQMYTYALQFTSNNEIIEDAIHDVFIRLHKNRSKLPIIHNIKLYLFIALKNELFNQLNQQQKFFYEKIEDIESTLNNGLNIEEEYIKQEIFLHKRELILKCYSILSLRQQEAIRYRFEENMGYKQISELMNINIQSAKNIIQTAIKKIRTIFF